MKLEKLKLTLTPYFSFSLITTNNDIYVMVWIFKKMCTRWYLDTGTAENADHTDGDQL